MAPASSGFDIDVEFLSVRDEVIIDVDDVALVHETDPIAKAHAYRELGINLMYRTDGTVRAEASLACPRSVSEGGLEPPRP